MNSNDSHEYADTDQPSPEFSLQAAILQAYGITAPRKIKGPLYYKNAPSQGEEDLWAATNELRKAIHRLAPGNRHISAPTQGWMRSALFLGIVSGKGKEYLDSLKEAIWAYTAALIEGVGKLCDNASFLENVPEGQKFEAYMTVIKELRHGINDQLRLLSEVRSAKIRYERNEPVLEYGRLLLKAVHAEDTDDTGPAFQGLAKAIGQYGPGGIPKTDWDAAVMIAKSILYYESRRPAPEEADTAKEGDSADTPGMNPSMP